MKCNNYFIFSVGITALCHFAYFTQIVPCNVRLKFNKLTGDTVRFEAPRGPYCNTPDPMHHVSSVYSSSLPCHLLACCILSCHHVHCIAYVFVPCIRAFSPLSVLQSGAPMSSGVPLFLSSCAGIKRSRKGPRLAKWPWYTTGRPPVIVPFGGRLVLQRLTGQP